MSDRRQEVLEVAKRLFAERGVRQTTVREIGANAGILSGSLYHHFGSKDDIVDDLLRDFCSEVLERYRELSRTKAPPAEQLRSFARFGFSLLDEHTAEIIIIQDDYVDVTKFPQNKDPRFKYLLEFNQEVGKRWTALIRAGIKSGDFERSADPRIVYRLIRDAIIGATRWYEPNRGMSSEQVADQIVDIVLKGIGTL